MANEIKEDIRKRVLVVLDQLADPTYTEFFCPDCDMPVAQLHNAEVRTLTDIINFDTRQAVLIGVPHRGALGRGMGHCRTRYYFTLGEVS